MGGPGGAGSAQQQWSGAGGGGILRHGSDVSMLAANSAGVGKGYASADEGGARGGGEEAALNSALSFFSAGGVSGGGGPLFPSNLNGGLKYQVGVGSGSGAGGAFLPGGGAAPIRRQRENLPNVIIVVNQACRPSLLHMIFLCDPLSIL